MIKPFVFIQVTTVYFLSFPDEKDKNTVYPTLRILKNEDTESNQLQGAILSITFRQTKKIRSKKLQYNGSKTYMMSYGKRIITKYFSSPLDLTQSNFYELIDFDKKNYKRIK